ncbi:ribonuclease domain-containing protein [Kaistella faecalis]|uniref:ribonuclease domain-containing protein n=1 Tax=Kaistella faecalis TaxID=2852098 RepID=UPI001C4581C9|nr:ribonuclease domain-containing protein [Chryseobacterium faecale]UFK98457.1 ribonuclease N [Chryseobacterium faecale]
MNRQSLKLVFFFIIGMLTAFLVMYLVNNYKIEKKSEAGTQQTTTVTQESGYADRQENQQNIQQDSQANKERNSSTNSGNIDDLTEENLVIDYVKANRKLPHYYITKGEARSKGWVASEGNLCDVLPGRAIGGDKFSNREKTLPIGAQYFEADVNYNCGRRNADRIVFTKNGEVWLTKNHYKSFEKQ